MSEKAASAAVKPFLDRLAAGTVVFDGAMGTMLYARGVFLNRCFDELNLSNPGLVRQVHDEYLEAGADVIETNTFGAHRFKLGPHGLEAQVRKINREGARIAREAAKGRALVAGAIGPIGKPLAPIGHVRLDEAQEAYREQAEGLLEGGVDLFLLETMPSLDQAKAALAAVRSLTSDVPVAVSLTFNEEGNTIYGDTPGRGRPRARGPRGADDRGQLQPGPAGDDGDAAADGGGRAHGEAVRHAQRGLGGPRRGPLRVPVHARVHGHLGAPLPRGGGHGRSAAAAARRPRTSRTSSAPCACSSRPGPR